MNKFKIGNIVEISNHQLKNHTGIIVGTKGQPYLRPIPDEPKGEEVSVDGNHDYIIFISSGER